MSGNPDIVMTTRYVGAREVRAVSIHEAKREPDGSSAIDPARSHLNEILHGPTTQTEAVEKMRRAGVKPPTSQAEAPFVQMVLSASPEFFRDDSDDAGTWSEEALHAWKDRTMTWLRSEYGADLAHVSLHLDEDTPHMHVLVVPTYEKKPRKPGRQRKNETDEQFEERKRAAENGETIRTMSRSSSPYWKQAWCRRDARISYHKAMEPLGLSYGTDHVGTGDASPERKETGTWVREQAAQVKADRAEIERERAQLAAERSRLAGVRETVERLVGAVADRLGVRRDLAAISEALTEVDYPLSRPDRDADTDAGSPSDIARMIEEARGETPDNSGPDI